MDSRSIPLRLRSFVPSLALSISPLSYALAFVALLSATLFVLLDTARAFEAQRQRQALVSELATAQPLLARQFAARAVLPAEGSDTAQVTAELVGRAAAAYGLALVMAALGLRRRSVSASGSLDDLVATIPFGVACWSPEGRLRVCNAQYRARLGADSLGARPGASYAASIQRLIEGGYMRLVREDAQSRILELHREDGSCLIVDERPLASGGFVTLISDVTESRRTNDLLVTIREEQRVLARRYHEEKLRAEAASRAKTSFLAHVSHDIRTPLNHIIGFAELMRQETYGPLGDERYADYAESIRSSGERLLSFFASILDYAELEGGRRVLQETPLGVDELLAATVRRFTPQAQRKGISLTQGAPCGAMLMGDRFSLERMLGNLVDNAVRFTPAGGRVCVAAYAAADGVVLEVTDTGIGMSPERLSSLSQPFAYGDAALTRDREGAGLGLAIARAIVELSGGRLAIDSREGIGTTVAVSLPLQSRQAQIAA
ncbi:MAG TPA: ATP-binding protein [Devosia sp.]|nr:ATP-binding protein [Devosia sp.]